MSSKYKECVAYRVSDKELKKMYDSDFALRLASMFDFNTFKKTAKETSVKLAMKSELKARCSTLNKTNKTNKTKRNKTKRFKRRK